MISKPWSSRNEIVGTTNRSIAAIPSAWLRRNVLHPCEGGTLLRTIYLATLVWPTSMPSLRSSPWILGVPHNGLATLIWRISWRISTVTAGRPKRCFDFRRQYDLNPARCQRITVSGRTIASAPYILGNSRQTPPNINLSIDTNRSLKGLARRSTLICCLSTRISASSATCDRNRSPAIPKNNRHKSSIGYQHRAILSQLQDFVARMKSMNSTFIVADHLTWGAKSGCKDHLTWKPIEPIIEAIGEILPEAAIFGDIS